MAGEVVALAHTDARQEWAARITDAWQSGATGFIETGRRLIQAKGRLDHGEWLAMIESDLPFGPNTAQRLMTIAADQRLTNTAHAPLLPPSWTTLYEITKLDDKTFEAKIADGTINPGMQRKALAPPKPKKSKPKSTSETHPLRGRAAVLQRLQEAIRVISGMPSPDEILRWLPGTGEQLLIGEHLPAAARWLAAFADIWPEEGRDAEGSQ